MPIQARKNQYRGVNAHLHSILQADGSWEMFHTAYITHLAQLIGTNLPSGYRVMLEYTLQLREYHPDTGEKIRNPKPDVIIFQKTASPDQTSASASPATTQTLSLIETLMSEEELYLPGIIIYEVVESMRFGKPVTQIEVLSATNKRGGSGYINYQEKRIATVTSGLTLVEVDFLHETASPILRVADYTRQQDDSNPYYIAISDPHPSLEQGQTRVFGFGVDVPIPTLDIPLKGSEIVTVDFGLAYNRSFEGLPTFSDLVDYEQLPENFDTYSPADQQRIRDRMQAVAAAHQQGVDLDSLVANSDIEN